MNFLLPGAAWLALLAFVPVLFLYLVRQRARERTVSTLLFWDTLAPQLRAHPLWQRLRRWLSYLLQVLCLLLLVAVLARPVRDGQSSAATATVLILDTSASLQATDTDGTRAWDRLLAAARDDLANLRASDRVAILSAGASPEIVRPWTGNRRRALEALAPLAPGDTPSDPVAALRLARELAATTPNARIRFLTDRVWSAPPPAELLAGVELVTIANTGPNAGLVRFDARRSFSAPGAFTLTAKVAVSPAAAWKGEALLHRDGKLIDARELNLPAGGEWSYAWTETTRSAATYKLVLENTAGHRLALDKSATLTVPALPRPVVRIVGARQPFLEAALASLPEVDFAFIDPSALSASAVSVVAPSVSSGSSTPASPSITPAPSLVSPPASTLWIFSVSTPPADFPRDRRVLLLDPPAAAGFWGTATADAPRADTPLVTDWQRAHPLFRYVDFSTVRPGAARVFKPAPDAEIFASSFETPVLFGRWDDRAHWLVIPFDLTAGNLVFRTAFPIFLSNLLQDAPADGGIASAPLPGATVTRLSPGNAELPLGSSAVGRELVRAPTSDVAPSVSSGSSTPATPPAAPAKPPSTFLSWLPPLEPWRVLIAIALLWTLLEWRLYARRVTE